MSLAPAAGTGRAIPLLLLVFFLLAPLLGIVGSPGYILSLFSRVMIFSAFGPWIW